MPGETLEEAVDAAAELRELGLATVLTELGENVSNAAQAIKSSAITSQRWRRLARADSTATSPSS